jgi:hypothetical protein
MLCCRMLLLVSSIDHSWCRLLHYCDMKPIRWSRLEVLEWSRARGADWSRARGAGWSRAWGADWRRGEEQHSQNPAQVNKCSVKQCHFIESQLQADQTNVAG